MKVQAEHIQARRGYAFIAAGAACLLTMGLVAAAPTASASTVVAKCKATADETLSKPLDPGAGNNAAQSITVKGTGTIECFDAAGAPLVKGTAAFTATFPADRCTGSEIAGSADSTVTWSDRKITKAHFGKIDDVNKDGDTTLKMSGAVSADSTRFVGYSVSITGDSKGGGCGGAGQTAKKAVTTVTYNKP
jgi:hypothetical protein